MPVTSVGCGRRRRRCFGARTSRLQSSCCTPRKAFPKTTGSSTTSIYAGDDSLSWGPRRGYQGALGPWGCLSWSMIWRWDASRMPLSPAARDRTGWSGRNRSGRGTPVYRRLCADKNPERRKPKYRWPAAQEMFFCAETRHGWFLDNDEAVSRV